MKEKNTKNDTHTLKKKKKSEISRPVEESRACVHGI